MGLFLSKKRKWWLRRNQLDEDLTLQQQHPESAASEGHNAQS
jgi:hypothetical protein